MYRPAWVDSSGSDTAIQGTLAQPPQPHEERTANASPTLRCSPSSIDSIRVIQRCPFLNASCFFL